MGTEGEVGVNQRLGGSGWRTLQLFAAGGERKPLYFRLLIAYVHSYILLPANANSMEKMNMRHEEQYISVLHSVQFVSTAEYNVPLFMDVELTKKNERQG